MEDRFAGRIEIAGLTDVGLKRDHNEDTYCLEPETGLAMVADGMGGHSAGEIASQMATETVADFLYEYDPEQFTPDVADTGAAGDGSRIPSEPAHKITYAVIRAAVENANRRINEENQLRGFGDGYGMGTTAVGFWAMPNETSLAVFWVGDSRMYRLRNGEMTLLTEDHTLYNMWVKQGNQGAPPQKNVILKALGPYAEVTPDVFIESWQSGDIYMLCSDGLSSMATDEQIADVMATLEFVDLYADCRKLIDLANACGGKDNVTVILAKCL